MKLNTITGVFCALIISSVSIAMESVVGLSNSEIGGSVESNNDVSCAKDVFDTRVFWNQPEAGPDIIAHEDPCYLSDVSIEQLRVEAVSQLRIFQEHKSHLDEQSWELIDAHKKRLRQSFLEVYKTMQSLRQALHNPEVQALINEIAPIPDSLCLAEKEILPKCFRDSKIQGHMGQCTRNKKKRIIIA